MGSLLSDSDDCPRMRMRDPEPTAPEEMTCTPAARPEISSPVVEIGVSAIFDVTSIDATVFEISALLCTPVTVVTTAARENGAGASATSNETLAPAATVTLERMAAYPMRVTWRSTAPGLTPRIV